MSQTAAIIDVLKRTLREQGITYKQVALHLKLSEASVKRLFSEQQFSLQRLDQVCQLLGIEISDLTRKLNTPAGISMLSKEQEQELVSDIKLLITAVSALNRWRYEDILEVYEFTSAELIKKLARLDQMGLIELLPNNRIKPLIQADFNWQHHGPIQRFFEAQVQHDFVKCTFTQPGELRLFISGMLSAESNRLLRDKLKRLAQDFRSTHQQDLSLPLAQRYGMSLLLAIRPWELGQFVQHRRATAKKSFPPD